ncbi:hypothetical protein [Saccharopolyspora halophila]|uniref:hypothetical protein n=1 Tax=Saccharopolyspora halophila TaxID=405551 RepID=UPI0031D285DC
MSAQVGFGRSSRVDPGAVGVQVIGVEGRFGIEVHRLSPPRGVRPFARVESAWWRPG